MGGFAVGFPIVIRLYSARYLLSRVGLLLEGGGVCVQEGRIVELLGNPAAVRSRAGESSVEWHDLGDVVLTPGLVNAHAHLELGWAKGLLSGDAGFADWVVELIRARRDVTPEDEVAALISGANRLLETGTTTVGDIDASGARLRMDPHEQARGPFVLHLPEVLDGGDPTRSEAALERLRGIEDNILQLRPGLSPHAPFTVSPGLLRSCAAYANSRELAVQVHWAESEEERLWLLQGEGPFAGPLGNSPRQSGLQLLDQAGLLGRRTSLVHANLPESGDHERVASSGASIVHCPGTHAFFGRDPFQWQDWLKLSVPLALGTDSLASNADLDLRREMSLARDAAPDLDPEVLWKAATEGGARALCLETEVGALAPGLRADFALFDLGGDLPSGTPSAQYRSLLESLTSGEGNCRGVPAAASVSRP
ncbi:MAG: cytosine/adenosine deaminase-related metal-dependent hydrolase [Planctomycetota bacterium]|jgi:cytosine/adenosine deaminase-related metal-dependent hydrolase